MSDRKPSAALLFSEGNLLQQYGAVFALAFLILFNCAFTGNFISSITIWNLVIQSTTVMFLALGMTTVIATGGIDISVGSVMALSAMIAAKLIFHKHILLGVFSSLGAAAVCGFIVGTIIIRFRVQPMITTLAMMYALRGVAKLINNGTVMNYRNRPFSSLAYIRVWDAVPIQLFIIIVLVAVMYVLLRKTRFGFYVEAYGTNPRAARIAGVNTVAVVVCSYVICAVLAGCSGLMEAALVSGVDPANMGFTKEMDAIAATAVGGTLMTGGRPNVLGTVCGVFALQLVTMMVNMNNVPYSYSLVIKTLIIGIAVYVQNVRRQA